MASYSEKISSLLHSLSHCGRNQHTNATGASANFECGSFVRISLKIDQNTGLIESAEYKSNGCGYMIAAAEVLSEHLAGNDLTSLGGEFGEVIANELGAFPESRSDCSRAVNEAAKDAFTQYRHHRLEEFQGEKAIVCTCFFVSEETLLNAIRENDLTDVRQVSAVYRAGSGCGACRMLIQDLIDTAHDR